MNSDCLAACHDIVARLAYADFCPHCQALRVMKDCLGTRHTPCGVQECYREVDGFLAGHNLVLQAEEHDSKALINAVMASTVQHPLWLDVIDLMMERSGSSENVLYATGAMRHP